MDVERRHCPAHHLIGRVLDGDPAACAQFYGAFMARWRTCVARSVPADEVDDVFQELLLAVHLALPRYRRDACVAHLISVVARHKIADWHRRHSGRPVPVDPAALATRGQRRDARALAESELFVHQVEAALPPRQRQAVCCHLVDGASFRELAEDLGTSAAAAKSLYHRAVARLRAAAGDAL